MAKTKNEDYSRYCQIVGATDVGCKRAANEDFLGQEDTINGRVAVVCDGMGGHVGGATASHIAVETILNYLSEHYHEDPRDAVSESIIQANRAIIAHAQMHPELNGMGSTCVLLLIREGLVYIGHVGDSRIYLIRKRHIHQLTKDHSFVQMLVDEGQITKEQAEHHPRKNEITNALGIPNMQSPTVRQDAIQPEAGDVFLLCSDGLSGMVNDEEICKTVSRISEMRAQQRADMLIEQARQNGGLDNITCELVEFSISPVTGNSGNKDAFKKRTLWIVIIALALILGIGAAWWRMKPREEPQKQVAESQPKEPVEETPSQPIQQEIFLGEIPNGKKGEVWCVVVFDKDGTHVKSKDEKETQHTLRGKSETLKVKAGNKLATWELTSSDIKKISIKLAENLKPGEEVSFSIGDEQNTTIYKAKVADSKGKVTTPTTGGKPQKAPEGVQKIFPPIPVGNTGQGKQPSETIDNGSGDKTGGNKAEGNKAEPVKKEDPKNQESKPQDTLRSDSDDTAKGLGTVTA